MKKLLSFSFVIVVLIAFSGCADKKYRQGDVGTMNSSYKATVMQIEGVKLEGDGTGSLIGMLVGFFVGNQIGDGAGRAVASFTGSIAGSIAGKKADYLNGLKLKLKFDDGRIAITILKRDNENEKVLVGDRVNVLISRNRIIDIELANAEPKPVLRDVPE